MPTKTPVRAEAKKVAAPKAPSLRSMFKECPVITVRVKKNGKLAYQNVPVSRFFVSYGEEVAECHNEMLTLRVGAILQVKLQAGMRLAEEGGDAAWDLPRGFIDRRLTYSTFENVDAYGEEGDFRRIERHFGPVQDTNYGQYFEHVDASMLVE